MFDLTGKIAVVSGGAKGIGRGIVTALKKGGATIVIADIDEKTGSATAAELGTDFMALDVTSQSQCRAVISKVREKYGRLDILCSNTGIFPQCTIKSMTEQDWDTMQKVNVKGMFFLVQAALGVMEEQKYGRIVITSSITGPVTGFPAGAITVQAKPHSLVLCAVPRWNMPVSGSPLTQSSRAIS